MINKNLIKNNTISPIWFLPCFIVLLFYSYLIFSLHSPFEKAQDYASSVEVELASILIYGNEKK